MINKYNEYPVLAKLAGALWLMFGLLMMLSTLYVLAKTKDEWIFVIMVFAAALLFFAPGYGVIFNKIKGLVIPSFIYMVIAIHKMYSEIISDIDLAIYGTMLFSSLIALIGNKKYKSYIEAKKDIKEISESSVSKKID